MRTPSLASVPIAVASCTAVTVTPWPKLMFARLISLHFDAGSSFPDTSPGVSIPVRRAKPNDLR